MKIITRQGSEEYKDQKFMLVSGLTKNFLGVSGHNDRTEGNKDRSE